MGNYHSAKHQRQYVGESVQIYPKYLSDSFSWISSA